MVPLKILLKGPLLCKAPLSPSEHAFNPPLWTFSLLPQLWSDCSYLCAQQSFLTGSSLLWEGKSHLRVVSLAVPWEVLTNGWIVLCLILSGFTSVTMILRE